MIYLFINLFARFQGIFNSILFLSLPQLVMQFVQVLLQSCLYLRFYIDLSNLISQTGLLILWVIFSVDLWRFLSSFLLQPSSNHSTVILRSQWYSLNVSILEFTFFQYLFPKSLSCLTQLLIFPLFPLL